MIKSANDSAELVAEYLGNGDRETFVEMMNKRAGELHLSNTHFYNPHGLPNGNGPKRQENYSCAESLAYMAEMLLRYPVAVKMASTWKDHIREGKKRFDLVNHNKLVSYCPGVDGMKTGFTNKAMFCIAVTCKRNNRRLIAVVTGFPSWRTRNKFVSKLLNWGYKRNLK